MGSKDTTERKNRKTMTIDSVVNGLSTLQKTKHEI